MPTLEDIVHEYHAALPHPLAPNVTQGDFPVAMRLATLLKFGQGHASPQEAANFWHEYQAMNQNLQAQGKAPIAPEEFTHLTSQMARSSFAYHGRPPSMYEVQRLRDADPKVVSDYYYHLPDEHYPTVPAGEMARAMHAAAPWAQQALGREPVKLEAAYLYHSGQNPRDYFGQMSDGGPNQAGGQPGDASAALAGGQPAGSRTPDSGLASGNAAAGWPQGVSQG